MTSSLRSLLWSFPLLAACAVGQPPAPGTLRIGTWNLEWLGIDDRGGLPPRDADDYAKIGAKVRELGVAVLAVQEIGGEAPLQKLAAAAGPGWGYVLGTTGGIEGKPQNIGFLYDGNVVDIVGVEQLSQLPRELEGLPIFNRVPLTACFRVRATGFDFRAITVHLKAGQKAQDEQKRRLESATLHDWIAGLEKDPKEDQDIVLLGDCNSTYGAAPQQEFEKGGTLQYVLQPTATPTIQHFPEPIDQIATGPGFAELQRTTYVVHDDLGGLTKEAWRKTYSDHYPVTIEINADHDTDPDATFRAPDPDPSHRPLEPHRAPARGAVGAAAHPAAPSAGPKPGGTGVPGPGARIRVQWEAGGENQATGTLLANLPEGPGGWLHLQRDHGGAILIPYARVVCVEVQ